MCRWFESTRRYLRNSLFRGELFSIGQPGNELPRLSWDQVLSSFLPLFHLVSRRAGGFFSRHENCVESIATRWLNHWLAAVSQLAELTQQIVLQDLIVIDTAAFRYCLLVFRWVRRTGRA